MLQIAYCPRIDFDLCETLEDAIDQVAIVRQRLAERNRMAIGVVADHVGESPADVRAYKQRHVQLSLPCLNTQTAAERCASGSERPGSALAWRLNALRTAAGTARNLER